MSFDRLTVFQKTGLDRQTAFVMEHTSVWGIRSHSTLVHYCIPAKFVKVSSHTVVVLGPFEVNSTIRLALARLWGLVVGVEVKLLKPL